MTLPQHTSHLTSAAVARAFNDVGDVLAGVRATLIPHVEIKVAINELEAGDKRRPFIEKAAQAVLNTEELWTEFRRTFHGTDHNDGPFQKYAKSKNNQKNNDARTSQRASGLARSLLSELEDQTLGSVELDMLRCKLAGTVQAAQHS